MRAYPGPLDTLPAVWGIAKPILMATSCINYYRIDYHKKQQSDHFDLMSLVIGTMAFVQMFDYQHVRPDYFIFARTMFVRINLLFCNQLFIAMTCKRLWVVIYSWILLVVGSYASFIFHFKAAKKLQ